MPALLLSLVTEIKFYDVSTLISNYGSVSVDAVNNIGLDYRSHAFGSVFS